MSSVTTKERPVLLVEDNARDAELLRDALEDEMDISRIVHVRDGVAALEWLERTEANGERLPLLVLLDLKMPRMTGMELLARLRQDARFRYLPVVMMTSSQQEQDLLGAYELGVNAYVRKPLEFEAFVAMVRHLMHFWVRLNLLPQREVA
jgi:two-component system response regulator